MANPKRRDLLTPDGDITGAPISRRDVLKALGLGGTLAVGTALGTSTLDVSATQESTPAPADEPPRRLPGGPTVEDKARELEYDVEKIFRFVADEIQYDAYAGALRGAKGTLWGMAGNSVDQALLLAALLEQALVPTRFVIGDLDDDGETKLLGSMSRDEASARARAERVLRLFPESDEASPVQDPSASLTPEEEEFLQSLQELREQLLAKARSQLDVGLQTIEDAFADADLSLPEFSLQLPDRERRQHVWVQYADGPLWIDLDSSMPNAAQTTTYASQIETRDDLPNDLYHSVAIRVVAEVVSGGQLVRHDLLSYQARTQDLVGVPVSFLHAKPEALKAIGLGITESLAGTVQYIPYLSAGEELPVPTGRVTFNSGEGALDALGETASSEGETIAEWLEIDVVTPDAAPQRIVREVFDRVGIEKRVAGTMDLEEVPPVEFTELFEADGTADREYPPLSAVSGIVVAGGMIPGRFLSEAADAEDPLANFSLAGWGYHHVREMLDTEIATGRGYRFYADKPNIAAFTLSRTVRGDDAAVSWSADIDIVHRSFGVAPIAGVSSAGQPRVLAGVLSHVAERISTEGNAGNDSESQSYVSVGRIIEEAKREGIALRVIQPGTPELARLTVSERARLRIKEALAAGLVVVVPEREVVLNGEAISGWWQVDPSTGNTSDQLENGKGADGLASESVLLQILNAVRSPIAKVGFCIAMGYYSVSVLLDGLTQRALAQEGAARSAFLQNVRNLVQDTGGYAIGTVGCFV